ncbi:MAG: NAD(P)H-dependent oxidoreductase [Cellvibrionaceae bacterium]|nr:NAD(P)H-dependent oxidoreductase [Cellvibrionaceae bacterium]
MSKPKILVISGHPNLAESNANQRVINRLQEQLDNVSVRDLGALYPNYQIDVEAEQAALLAADTVVLQYPFYWYSVPALLKKWLDDVFAYDFAYGANGDKLKGKNLLLSFTIGGPAESYQPLGYNHFSIEQLLHPLQQTAYLAGMNFVKAVYSHRMVYIPGVYNTLEEVERRADVHGDVLVKRLQTLHSDADYLISKFVSDWFAEFDHLAESPDFFLEHLSKDLVWSSPEGEFKGHSGFKDWYRLARQNFKPPCEHQVEQLSINALEGDKYQVEIRVRLIAQTQSDSPFNGEDLNLLVNEYWQLELDDQRSISISEYRVEVLQ